MYPHSFTSQKAMTDYDMSGGVGRTYKYYKGKPLFEYGTGLSYTTFAVACSKAAGGGGGVACDVTNTGDREGDEVVMMFHSAGDAIRRAATFPVPIKSLVDFQRVRLAAGEKITIQFAVTDDALKLGNAAGGRELIKGARDLIFSNGAGQVSTVAWTA